MATNCSPRAPRHTNHCNAHVDVTTCTVSDLYLARVTRVLQDSALCLPRYPPDTACPYRGGMNPHDAVGNVAQGEGYDACQVALPLALRRPAPGAAC